MNRQSKQFLNNYLGSLPENIAQTYSSFSADYFCADKHNANLCAELVLQGEKRATCSLDYWYSHKGETMPVKGHLQVVLDWSGNPICIIEITDVYKRKYKEVDGHFANEEGEGDKSLMWWREAHWQFFSAECNELNIPPTEDMLLVLEHFKVVHK